MSVSVTNSVKNTPLSPIAPTSNPIASLEQSLEKLDLKGLLVLNGLILQQALKVVLAGELVSNQYKQGTTGRELLVPNEPIIRDIRKI